MLFTILLSLLIRKSLCDRRIINGQAVDIKQYPFIVCVTDLREYCGGSILTPVWILTAAHCPRNFVMYGHTMFTDMHKRPKELLKVKRKAVLQLRNEPKDLQDMTVLQVERPIPLGALASRVKLPQRNYEVPGNYQTPVTVLGWGRNQRGPAGGHLFKAVITGITNKECNRLYMFRIHMPDYVMCLGNKKTFQGPCFGDSGGPAVLSDGTQVGVNAFVMGGKMGKCGGLDTPSGYMKVSKFIDQIEAATGLKRRVDGYLS